jgi:hypothetical protein
MLSRYPQKNPHAYTTYYVDKHVDIVDKLFGKKVFPDFQHISGTHSYQQIAVHTIFG